MSFPGHDPIQLSRPYGTADGPSPQGCGRPVLLGCGTLLVLTLIALTLLVARGGDIFRWSLEKIEGQIQTSLPSETDGELRLRLQQAFAEVADRYAAGDIDVAELTGFQEALLRFSEGTGDGIDVVEVERFVADLERVLDRGSGLPGGRDAPAPDPAPEPRPTPLPGEA